MTDIIIPENERWAPVPGFDAYEVSDYGRVRRIRGGQGARAGVILRQTIRKNKTPYRTVGLYRNGKGYTTLVHQIVALAFIGEPPTSQHVVAHFDGDENNMHVSNLRWATHTENMEDMRRHNRLQRGESHYKTTLSVGDVIKIRGLKECGETAKNISQMFKIGEQSVYDICRRRRWSHI